MYTADDYYRAQILTSAKESLVMVASGRIEPNGWQHVAMVVDDFAKQLHLFVDGKAVSGSPKTYAGTLSDLDPATGQNQKAGEYYIGSTRPDRGAGSFYTRHFKGLIAEARIYDRPLSAAEVARLFELGTRSSQWR